jgi:hypothetical protein
MALHNKINMCKACIHETILCNNKRIKSIFRLKPNSPYLKFIMKLKFHNLLIPIISLDNATMLIIKHKT